MNEEKMLGIGKLLKSKREELGLTLHDVEQQTFIHTRYLIALEEERWNDLPGHSYAYGYIKNYGRVLNLNPEILKESFQRSNPIVPKIEAPRNTSREYAPAKATIFKKILIFLIITAAVFTTLYLSIEVRKDGLFSNPNPDLTLVTPSPQATLLIASTLESSPLVMVVTPTPSPDYSLRVILKTDDVAWLQVTTADNRKIFSGVLVPQKEYEFQSNTPLIMSFLDGSKVRVNLNGVEAGFLAENDQRAERTFRP